MDENGITGKLERIAKIVDRFGTALVMLMILGYFFFGEWKFHDHKVDMLVQWTQRDVAFTYLDCLRKSANERQERSCERAYKGEITEPQEVRMNKSK
jgi:hypothetical protein